MPWCKTTKICATSRATTRTNDTKTPADAQADGVFDYVYVPRDMFFLSKFGKIIAIGHSEDEMREKMYEHYRAKYTYLY